VWCTGRGSDAPGIDGFGYGKLGRIPVPRRKIFVGSYRLHGPNPETFDDYDYLIIFGWPARARAGALDKSGIAVSFGAVTSVLYIAQEVNDIPSGIANLGGYVRRSQFIYGVGK